MTEGPPLDTNGRVEPHDHTQLKGEDVLIRGIPDAHIQRNGKPRLRSSAFSFSSGSRDAYKGMSLAAKKILECGAKSIEEWGGQRFAAVACLPAKTLRDLELKVGWDPLTGERAHCGAWGSLSKRERKRLAETVRWRFVEPAPSEC